MGNENLTPVVEETAEVIVKEAPKFNWKRTGLIGLAIVTTAGVGYGVYRLVKHIRAIKAAEKEAEKDLEE